MTNQDPFKSAPLPMSTSASLTGIFAGAFTAVVPNIVTRSVIGLADFANTVSNNVPTATYEILPLASSVATIMGSTFLLAANYNQSRDSSNMTNQAFSQYACGTSAVAITAAVGHIAYNIFT